MACISPTTLTSAAVRLILVILGQEHLWLLPTTLPVVVAVDRPHELRNGSAELDHTEPHRHQAHE